MTGLPTGWTVELDLGGVWTDVTAWHDGASSTSVQFGRTTEYGDIGVGTCSFMLRNEDGRFTPGWSGSPYYPDLTPGVGVRLSVTHGVTTDRVFTGKVTALEPQWPGASVAGGTVTVSCVDALSDLAAVTFADRWTEEAGAKARAASTWCDVPALAGDALRVTIDNDGVTSTTLGACTVVGSIPSFGSADGLTIGRSIAAGSASLLVVPQGAPQSIQTWTLPADDLVSATRTGTPLAVVYVGTTALFSVYWAWNSGTLQGDIIVRSGTVTPVGTVDTNVLDGAWRLVTLAPDSTPTNTLVTVTTTAGTTASLSVAFDMRTATQVSFGGFYNGAGSGSKTLAGPVVSGATAVDYQIGTGITQATSAAFTALQSYVPAVTSWALTGTADTTIGEPNWAGSNALTVLQDIARTVLGVGWCRPDGTVELRLTDSSWATASAATLDVDQDLDATTAPTFRYGADARPTRVTATYWHGATTYIDTAAEAAGFPLLGKSVATCAADQAGALAVAGLATRASDGLRISRVAVDAYSSVQDMWDELAALYPTTQWSLSGWPAAMAGGTTVAVTVQGWTVDASEAAWRVTFDCSVPGALPGADWDSALWDDPASVWR